MKKKVLIIEDEKTLRLALSEYLTEENFEVFLATDGEEGLEMIKAKMPDIIILDIILPKMDGFKILEEMNKSPDIKNTPVILLTNLESAEDIQKAFERGATNYLVKADYKLEDIVKKIKAILKI